VTGAECLLPGQTGFRAAREWKGRGGAARLPPAAAGEAAMGAGRPKVPRRALAVTDTFWRRHLQSGGGHGGQFCAIGFPSATRRCRKPPLRLRLIHRI